MEEKKENKDGMSENLFSEFLHFAEKILIEFIRSYEKVRIEQIRSESYQSNGDENILPVTKETVLKESQS